MKVLFFCEATQGGIAEHAFCQARALQEAGVDVTALVAPSFLNRRPLPFKAEICLPEPITKGAGIVKKLRMAWRIISSRYVLAWKVLTHAPDLVLLDSYSEYLSPLWADPHIILSRILGFRYAANLHDPIRDYIVGPLWWHRLSVWLSYQFLDFVLVHHKLPEPSPVPRRVRVVEVPHGLFAVETKAGQREAVRADWKVELDKKVFLSFGYVRDGKNIDLAIRALRDVPQAFLVVAGSVASSHDRPVVFYRKLAEELGVGGRCRFIEGFVADEKVGEYFAGADYVLLTYSGGFHSQSGVLNLAASARRPVLASAAPGPLLENVKRFKLGNIVVPDSQESLTHGMRSLISQGCIPDWEAYAEASSWGINAERLLQAAKVSGK